MDSLKTFAKNLLAESNRGQLLDLFVFVANLFLMRTITSLFISLFQLADQRNPIAQFSLLFACILMWALPAAGAVFKRWPFHKRKESARVRAASESDLVGCMFNPIFYFCLNLVLVSAIIAGAGQLLVGKKEMDQALVFVPSIFLGLFLTIVQTYLIYQYFTAPKKPPRWEFLRTPQSELLGDVCLFLNMIFFQIVWNLLSFAGLGRPSGALEFFGRLFFLVFLAFLIYFPPRMFYLAEDIHRPRTWLTMLLANSPLIWRVLIGSASDNNWT